MHFFVNDTFVTKENAFVPVLDLGYIRGYGVFEYLRTYKQIPFHLKEHLLRFRYSAEKLGLCVPYEDSFIEKTIKELIQKNAPNECSIKLFLTGGVSEDQISPSLEPTFIAFAYPLTPYPQTCYTNGVKVITTTNVRTLPNCKTTNYLPAILALQKAKEKDALEALYLGPGKEVLEATTSNFFGFKNGTLITPKEEGVLLGITRRVIVEICKNTFPIEERSIFLEELPELDEAFLSASNKEIMPISHIDNEILGPPGPLTQIVMKTFEEYTSSLNWPFLRIERHEISPIYRLLDGQINKIPVKCARSV